MQLDIYLFFNGNCAEAFKFYECRLGGKIEMMMTYAEAPPGTPTTPEWHDKIMHAQLVIGGNTLMGSDPPKEMYEGNKGFAISMRVEDEAEAEHKFKALAENGAVRMPLGETFWAKRFGMVVDQFGILWMINCERPS
jgi:PhnB protein